MSSNTNLALSPISQAASYPVLQCTTLSPTSPSSEASESAVDQLIESMQSLELSPKEALLFQICKELSKKTNATVQELQQKENLLKKHLIRKDEEMRKLKQEVEEQQRKIEQLQALADDQLVEKARQEYLEQAQPMIDKVKQGVGVGTVALTVMTVAVGWFATTFKITSGPVAEVIAGGTASLVYTANQLTQESLKQELEYYENIYRQHHPYASKREVFEQAKAALEAKNGGQTHLESYPSYARV
jgi:predicted RNase H-like nuclease (RuvC/YqgF family)